MFTIVHAVAGLLLLFAHPGTGTWSHEPHESHSWNHTTDYSGFGDVSDLYWQGETKVSKYIPPSRDSSGLNAIDYQFGGEWRKIDLWMPPNPIELKASQRNGFARANATVDEPPYVTTSANYDASRYDGTAKTSEGPDGMYHAIFAEVVTEQDELLGQGNAIVEYDSHIADDGFSLNGRLATNALIEESLTESSLSIAYAQTTLSAEYDVHETLGYSLSASFGGVGDLLLELLVYHDDELVATHGYTEGHTADLQICGTLFPGEYAFRFRGSSNSQFIGQEAIYEGGEAVFDIQFDTESNPSHGGLLYLEEPHGEPDWGGLSVSHAVPEPEADAYLLALGIIAAYGLRRRRQRQRQR